MFSRPTWRNRVAYQVLATLLLLPFVLPLLWIVMISFGGEGAAANYGAVFTQTPFARFLVNSLIISVGTVGLVVAATMLAGYALGKLRFKGRELIFTGILAGLMLPGTALVVPLFTMVRRFGLFNNYIAVIVPLAAGLLPMTILLTRNFVKGIPDELLDAARIDGATTFGALIRIVIPLSRPIIAVVVVWAFLNSWNEFFLPLLFLQDTSLQAVTQIPTYFTSTYGSDVPKIFAALVLMCLPIVVAYVAFQKFFERGLTAGALK